MHNKAKCRLRTRTGKYESNMRWNSARIGVLGFHDVEPWLRLSTTRNCNGRKMFDTPKRHGREKKGTFIAVLTMSTLKGQWIQCALKRCWLPSLLVRSQVFFFWCVRCSLESMPFARNYNSIQMRDAHNIPGIYICSLGTAWPWAWTPYLLPKQCSLACHINQRLCFVRPLEYTLFLSTFPALACVLSR